jgi:glutamate-1-semialdehyde 2,1-aminomutase
MSFVSPDGPVYQAGTLSGNPVAMAAGLAQLKKCSSPDFYSTQSIKTNSFITDINNFCVEHNLAVELIAIGSIFWFSFNGKKRVQQASEIDSDMSQFNKLHSFLLNNGVYFGPSGYEVGFVSSAHDDSLLKDASQVIMEGLKYCLK